MMIDHRFKVLRHPIVLQILIYFLSNSQNCHQFFLMQIKHSNYLNYDLVNFLLIMSVQTLKS